MLEDINRIWITTDMFSTKQILHDTDAMLEVNLVLDRTTSAIRLNQIISELRLTRYGFEKSFCSIVIHSTLDLTPEIISTISKNDDTLPCITLNLLVSDKDFINENIISRLHSMYNKMSNAMINHEYTFMLTESLANAKRMLYIISKFKALIGSYDNNISVDVKCDVALNLISASESSISASQLGMDNIIFGIVDEIENVEPSKTCGLISIIYYIALIKEMQYRYDSIDVFECIHKYAKKQGCYFCANSQAYSCLDCIKKYLDIVPKNLGQASVVAKKMFREEDENDELKILEADWDYIV